MTDLRLPAVIAANEAPANNPASDGAANAATAFDAVMARYTGAPGQPARDAQHAEPPPATPTADEDETTAVESALAAVDAAAWVAAAAALAPPNGAAAPPAPVTADATAADGSGDAAAQAPVEPAAIAATAPGKARSADIVAARAERTPVPDSAALPQSAAAATARLDPRPALAATARAAAVEQNVAPEAAGPVRAEAVAANATAAPHVLPHATAGAPAAAPYSFAHATVSAPVAGPAFAPEFAQRVVLFARSKLQHAEISVTPAELGPISVSIEVRGQEASLSFAAPSHATRAAIEEALPRLRELLAAQGLQLTGAEVNDQPRREYARSAAVPHSRREAPGAPRAEIEAAVAPRRRSGLIDIVV